jgi:hypothetical protein
MSEEEKIEVLLVIREMLFNMANSYAGEETGHIAVMLHESCNWILRATHSLEQKT